MKRGAISTRLGTQAQTQRRRCRVDSDGGLSYLTRKRDPLFLNIPEDRQLILAAIGCGRRGGYDGNIQRRDIPPVYSDHGPSDKARYCRGVLDLFGGIQSAHQTFETRFWKDVFYYLAGLGDARPTRRQASCTKASRSIQNAGR
jgi:hypothetical protein